MDNNNASVIMKKLNDLEHLYLNESPAIRPVSQYGYPGGVIILNTELPTIIVPDLHGRLFFLKSLLEYKINNISVKTLLDTKSIQIVCVGDGFHGERRVRDRWLRAALEFEGNFLIHENIDLEMEENFGLMELVMDLKLKYPEHFHFLKGNHENILNEDIDGNYPFGKFTSEGKIVREWVLKFYGENFLNTYARFEKYLPLFAIGKNFLISHAEPKEFYDFEKIVDYRDNQDVIYGLTWTRDNQAVEGSVEKMLNNYITDKNIEKSLYFTGHRTISGIYNLRANSKLMQIHNPDNCNVVYIPQSGELNINKLIKNIL